MDIGWSLVSLCINSMRTQNRSLILLVKQKYVLPKVLPKVGVESCKTLMWYNGLKTFVNDFANSYTTIFLWNLSNCQITNISKLYQGKCRRNFNSNIFSMNCDVWCTFDPSSMPKSLHRRCAGRHFYGTEMWSGLVLGRLAILKKSWADYEQHLTAVFSCFMGKKCLIFQKKYCSVRTKKLHNITSIIGTK